MNQSASILYIPHGGGPLPLMDHGGHTALVSFLQQIPDQLIRPKEILVISAHWERDIPVITANPSPELIYDYFGFPEQAYKIDYPVPGAPDLAEKIYTLLTQARIKSKLDPARGLDHGVFVPLKLMVPKADIPCIQLSLTADLDPSSHLAIGRALSPLCRENILILGSGFSFHNMHAFGKSTLNPKDTDPENEAFQNWLIETCTDPALNPSQVEERLIHWENAPHARYCHPREEHLLPLHVCAGIAGYKSATTVFQDTVLGKKTLAFLWQEAQ
ncbi:MAG: dioxygenase [Desulfamplus sp.]|nr:dioxygenase [Desulfamplus sp.]